MILDELVGVIYLGANTTDVLIDVVTECVTAFTLNFAPICEAASVVCGVVILVGVCIWALESVDRRVLGKGDG